MKGNVSQAPQTPIGTITPTKKLSTKEKIRRFIKSPQVFAPILAYLILLGPTLYVYSGSPSESEVEVYKGVWLTTVFPSHMAGLKKMGVNTVFFYGYPDEGTIALIQAAHRNGLKVGLTLDIKSLLSPNPEASEIDMEALNFRIIETAKIAEKYGVELFGPLAEPDAMFDINTTKRWAQEILPRVRDVYHGDIVWRGASVLDINLSGYDYIGFTLSVDPVNTTLEDWAGAEAYVDNNLNQALVFAERDNCKGIMVTDFGAFEWESKWGEPLRSEEDIARAYEIVLERGKGKAAGFFYLDKLPGVFGKTEEVISKWYKEIL